MAKKILVVDDEEDIREAIESLLQDQDYDVSTVKDAKECLAILKKKKFDLILIDFFMPEMTGRDLAEAIRKNKKTKNMKFAFLTVATFGRKGREQLEELGSLDYIKKPVDNDDFLRRVKRMV